jgi:hypothetical protein
MFLLDEMLCRFSRSDLHQLLEHHDMQMLKQFQHL